MYITIPLTIHYRHICFFYSRRWVWPSVRVNRLVGAAGGRHVVVVAEVDVEQEVVVGIRAHQPRLHSLSAPCYRTIEGTGIRLSAGEKL